jgi:hypothetical protein
MAKMSKPTGGPGGSYRGGEVLSYQHIVDAIEAVVASIKQAYPSPNPQKDDVLRFLAGLKDVVIYACRSAGDYRYVPIRPPTDRTSAAE